MVRIGTVLRALTLCGLALTTLAFARTSKSKTIVTYPSAFAVSQRLSELPIDLSPFAAHETPEPRPSPLRSKAVGGPWQQEDPVLQKEIRPLVAAIPGVDFDGVPANGWAPSDSNLAVGPNHIVETVNVQFAVYSKSGTLLTGPTNFTTFFAPLGGDCAAGSSDPIVLYDRQADRWLISDIGINSTFSECVGVSTTNDPTGAYVLYAYSFGTSLNDYPKLGVWPTASNSAYLATYNVFAPAGFAGADLCGLDRAKMLLGDSSAAQLCQLSPNNEGSYLPSDMDGPTPPTNGTPGLYLTWHDNNPGQLLLRSLTLNFAVGTATLSSPTTISVANDSFACGNGGTCVPQSGTTQTLDTLGDRLMYRFAIRHFADHDRAVVNHAVGNGSQVAVRWYELYDPAGNVTLNQQGTFAPDTTYRWMASMAEDKNGDIGLGYSASSSTIHPAVRFTGRVPSDPLGTLESEASILEPNGSQNGGLSRWGDYTALQVDPSDDCTFWYVDQYEKVNGKFNWSTTIGSFAFVGCSGNPTFFLSASPSALTVNQGSSGTSTVTVAPLNGFTGSVNLAASGLPSGVTAAFSPNPATSTSTLTLTASAAAAKGTATVTITGTSGSLTQTTTLSLIVVGPDFSLTATPNKLSIPPGSSGTSTIAVAPANGFTGSVSLAASGLPSGVTAGLTPNPTTSTSALTLTVSPSAGAATKTVTITGTSGSLTHTTTLTLMIKGAKVKLAPTSLTWGSVLVGKNASVKTVTLTNTGNATLNISTIAISGDFFQKVVTGSCGSASTVLAGKSCVIKVNFSPTQVGLRTGTVTITDNAAGSPQTVALSGTGK